MVEAEAHAIWKTNQGFLIDITPKDDPCDKILFISDNINYSGQHIDNIRLNISRNKLIDDFILLAELRFSILNAGDRASKHNISLDIEEFDLLNYISSFGQSIITMARSNMNHNSRCFCGEGRRYKHCHGENLKKHITKRIKLLEKI